MLGLYKRPATLREARAIIYASIVSEGARWENSSRNPTRMKSVRYLNGKRIATSINWFDHRHMKRLVGIVVIGNDNFATTEFMGQYVRRILTAVNDYEDEFNLGHEIMMRVRQEERNGHLVWRAYLVTRVYRKEVLMG